MLGCVDGFIENSLQWPMTGFSASPCLFSYPRDLSLSKIFEIIKNFDINYVLAHLHTPLLRNSRFLFLRIICNVSVDFFPSVKANGLHLVARVLLAGPAGSSKHQLRCKPKTGSVLRSKIGL